MLFDTPQHNAICLYLSVLGYRDIAYWVRRANRAIDVFVARETRLAGDKRWPATVNLIQGMFKRDGRQIFADGDLCIPQGVFFTAACHGMLDFFATIEYRGGIHVERQAVLPEHEPLDDPAKEAKRPDVFLANAKLALDAVQITIHVVEPAHDDDRFVDFCREAGATPTHVNLANSDQASHLHRLYMMLVFNRLTFMDPRHGHRIGAALVEQNGRVRFLASNRRAINQTFHAEVNIIQSTARFAPELLDRRCYLYTSLKPCKMCAGMIAACMPQCVVHYAQNDPGRHARDLVDIPRGSLQQLGSGGTKALKTFQARPHVEPEPVPPGLTEEEWRFESGIADSVAMHEELAQWQASASTGTLSAALDTHRRSLGATPLTSALNHPGAPGVFSGASHALGRKIAKYGDEHLRERYRGVPTLIRQHRRTAIREVLAHIRPLVHD